MKILVTGPESSGKTSLARTLAWAVDGRYVAEQARAYLHRLGRDYGADDLPRILAAQLAAEEEARASGASVVVCDTGPEVIRIWAEVKYGRCPASVADAFQTRHYDLTLLCVPDLPWQPDPLREAPDRKYRDLLFQKYRAILPHAHVVAGTDRVAAALAVTLPSLVECYPTLQPGG